jgi:Flp pilus assembly protein TadD
MTQASTGRDEGASAATRATERSAPVARDRAQGAGSGETPTPASESVPAGGNSGNSGNGGNDAIAAVLAERRRGDFPEIEFVDAGFTITEQVRIGNDARDDYERAIGLLNQNRLDEGIALLRNVTATAPDATSPYIDLGIAYARSGNLADAEEALKSALLLSPDNPIALNELGVLYRRSGRFAEARSSYERALVVFGGFHYARRNLGVLCDLYLADTACALQNYRAYLALVGTDAEVEIWVADLENRTNQGG